MKLFLLIFGWNIFDFLESSSASAFEYHIRDERHVLIQNYVVKSKDERTSAKFEKMCA